MKRIGLIILLASQVWQLQAQNLVLTVENIKHDKGQLIISLFSSPEDFLKTPCYEKYVSVGEYNQLQIVLEDVPKGDYALCVIHDKNSNGDIDKNFLKIPKEAYGFSHNPKSRFGPPEFNSAKFEFVDDLELTVRLN